MNPAAYKINHACLEISSGDFYDSKEVQTEEGDHFAGVDWSIAPLSSPTGSLLRSAAAFDHLGKDRLTT